MKNNTQDTNKINISIKERADKNKSFLIDKTAQFLKSSANFNSPLETNREEIAIAVQGGDFTQALQNLEILRDQKSGIKLIKIDSVDNNAHILIRDGRENTNEVRILGTEAFEMQYLNIIRAAIEIAEIEKKPELKVQLRNEAVKFMNNFHIDNTGLPQEEVSTNVKDKIDDVIKVLEKEGIKKPYQKINIAKDFQNFNDEHCNIVTLSNIKDNKGRQYTVVEGEVALKGITTEQNMEYANRSNKKWYTKMPDWEQELVDRYVQKITDGNHVIPTQLRQIVGMKNAFEKITAISDNTNQELEIIHNSKHAGTLASISRDNNSRQGITNLNAKQAQAWMGQDSILHSNTLNSGNIKVNIPEQDAKIVLLTNKAMNSVGGIHTNTAFNKFRNIAALNNLNGAKQFLRDLADNLPKAEEFDKIKPYLKPTGRINKIFGNKLKGDFEKLLNNAQKTHNLSTDTIEILKIAADLKSDIEKADVSILRTKDGNNISADVSKKLNYASSKILNSSDQIFSRVPKHQMLTMCASGKDRTGLAEHDQTVFAIANKLNIDTKYLDQQILKSGHTAGQAGGVHAGGATIGCYGTLKVTSQGFPESRKEVLQPMMEVTAANNKIKILKNKKKINELQEQLNSQELPNMYKNETYITTDKDSIAYAIASESSKNENIRKIVEHSGVLKELKNAINKRNIPVSKPSQDPDKSESLKR